MDKEKLLNSLNNLYELSSYVDTWEKEYKILTMVDELAEEFGVVDDFRAFLDSQQEIYVTDRVI